MALTPPGVSGTLLTNLVGTGHAGAAVPQLAQGLANGLLTWIALVKVTTVDTGTVGVGAGTITLLVPLPAIQGAMQVGFAANGIIGTFAPTMALGLSAGLSQAFLQGQVVTVHPSVGVGAGVCTFKGPPAYPFIQQGLSSTGVGGPGTSRLALAVGSALDVVFSALVLPTPIAGSPAPTASAGVGFGQIA